MSRVINVTLGFVRRAEFTVPFGPFQSIPVQLELSCYVGKAVLRIMIMPLTLTG